MNRKQVRNLKIASLLYRAVSRFLIEDDKIFNKNIVVISQVKLSTDLRKADLYLVLSSLNKSKYDINCIVDEMNRYSWLVRKSILSYINLRFVPKLIFKNDLEFFSFFSSINKY